MKKFLLGILTAIVVVFPHISKSQIGVGPAPYCMPAYVMQPCNQFGPSNAPGNSVNDFINSFNTIGALTNIVNNNSGCNAQNLGGTKNYMFWGCQHYLKVNPGQVVTCNFQSGNTFSQGFALFVDWNNNGVFNLPAERLIGTGIPPAGTFISGNFTVPPTQAPGAYRLRVRCVYSTSGNFIDPCNTYTYGECEDYMLYVGINPPGTGTITLTSNSPVCVGQVVNINTTITGGSGNPNTYTYTWSGPNGFTSSQMNPSFTATSTAMSGIYTLNIAPGNGCNSSATIQIWVNPNPSTSITNNGPLCQGSNAIFLNTILSNGVATYNWTGPNGFTSNVVSPTIPSAQPSNTGTYNFTIVSTFTNGGSCIVTSNSSLVIVPVSQVSVTPTYTQCQGTNISLNANVLGANSFSWTGPNYSSTQQTPILTSVTPTNSGNYSVTATFTSPSTTLVCSSTAVSNVSVVPMNPVSITPPQNICQNTNLSITATAAGNPNYVWTATNGFTGTLPTYTFNAQSSTTGTYSVSAVFSIGSVSCTTYNSTNISVVPVSSINVVPLISVCENDNAVLTATAQGAISYTWTGPNNFNIVQPLTYFQNLNPSWNGNYIVTAAFTNGNLTCYNTNTTTLVVNPKINFTLTPYNQLCYNSTYNVLGPLGGSTYTWTGPGYNSNTQNLFIPNVNLSNAGTYSLVVDLNGCKTYGSTNLQVLNPIVWQNVPTDKTLCKGDSFTLTAQAGNGSGNYAYHWEPSVYLTSPNGGIQTGVAMGTMIYNVSVYDVSCPTYTINTPVTLSVNVAPQPTLNLDVNKICEPFCFLYDSKVKNKSNLVSYDFNGKTFIGDSINICLNAGFYNLKITTIGKNGCKEIFKYDNILTVHPKPNADFTWLPNTPNHVSDNKVTFYPLEQSMKIDDWVWQLTKDSTSTIKTPEQIYETPGNYPISLMLITEHGCKDTVVKILTIDEELLIWVPNSFSPNSDGINETFKPKGSGIKNYDMVIFDRWGSIIHNTPNKEWDGTYKGVICQDGVYVYKIVITDVKGLRHDFIGHVTLLK
jgi:hypothetical protein